MELEIGTRQETWIAGPSSELVAMVGFNPLERTKAKEVDNRTKHIPISSEGARSPDPMPPTTKVPRSFTATVKQRMMRNPPDRSTLLA